MAGDLPRAGRGILRARTGLERFQVSFEPPPADLAAYAGTYWILTWDLRGRPPHRQQVLTTPEVNLTFTTGGRARIVGVQRGLFSETIEDRGRVVGVRFRPGGFRPFLGAPVSTITDRYVPVEEIFGPRAREVADAIIAADRPGALALMGDFLRSRAPRRPDPAIDEVAEIVERLDAESAIVRVADLAAAAGVSTRRLQRLFSEYVGAGPKWVIRRSRMREAAERAAAGADVDWAELAADLGYADQAHFIRDFTATVGLSPTRYARECAERPPATPGKIGS